MSGAPGGAPARALTLELASQKIPAVQSSRCNRRWLALAPWIGLSTLAAAQDLEPRRWTHLPVGTNVTGLGYLYTTGDLSFDPVLRIEDAEVELQSLLISLTRYFALGERTARIDVVLPLQTGEWDGLVDGAPRAVSREGLGDPVVRFSVHLAGSPALTGKEYMAFRQAHPAQTTVGAALEIRVPIGEYDDQKLINLGQNRWSIGPQLGVLHTTGEWSFELTGTSYFYGDNDDFFGGHELEQDPLFAAQAHVVRTFGRAWWLAAGAGYSWGGESTIDDVPKDDDRANVIWGGSWGVRIGDTQSLRIAYARNDTRVDVGSETDSVYIGWAMRF